MEGYLRGYFNENFDVEEVFGTPLEQTRKTTVEVVRNPKTEVEKIIKMAGILSVEKYRMFYE